MGAVNAGDDGFDVGWILPIGGRGGVALNTSEEFARVIAEDGNRVWDEVAYFVIPASRFAEWKAGTWTPS